MDQMASSKYFGQFSIYFEKSEIFWTMIKIETLINMVDNTHIEHNQ